ncbi:hypothetical protein ACTXT7_000687 [Hymenolepis weldensis]
MHCPSPDDYIEEDDNFSCETSTEMERKRRRGIIEKKRRDRINYLLSELRRIIPLGAQKQTLYKLNQKSDKVKVSCFGLFGKFHDVPIRL